MANIFRSTIPIIALALPSIAGTTSPVPASALLSACSADIASLCKGVKKGRGRISACLFAHSSKISTACRPELSKVTSSRTFENMIPPNVLRTNGTVGEAHLRQVCAAEIKSMCASVTPGSGRLLACLYARSNRVSGTCHAQARTVLDDLKQ